MFGRTNDPGRATWFDGIKANVMLLAPYKSLKALGAPLGAHIVAHQGAVAVRGDKTIVPLAGARAEMFDGTGSRFTMTRFVALGPFALAAKKKTGHVTLVVAGQLGESFTLQVSDAGKAFEFVTAFNAAAAS